MNLELNTGVSLVKESVSNDMINTHCPSFQHIENIDSNPIFKLVFSKSMILEHVIISSHDNSYIGAF